MNQMHNRQQSTLDPSNYMLSLFGPGLTSNKLHATLVQWKWLQDSIKFIWLCWVDQNVLSVSGLNRHSDSKELCSTFDPTVIYDCQTRVHVVWVDRNCNLICCMWSSMFDLSLCFTNTKSSIDVVEGSSTLFCYNSQMDIIGTAVTVLEQCAYYWSRVCIKFALSGTKWTVSDRVVSVVQR